MRAIVLTYAPVTKEEAKLLKNTDVFKIATNFSAVDLKPNLRLTADDIVDKCLDCDTCPVVSLNYDLEKDRVINACRLPARHSSLLSCIDYLYLNGYTQVLLVASNPDSATCKINYEGINSIKDYLYLYKYSKDGNMDIPYISIKEFLMLTDEEKLLGITEQSPKKLLANTLFTDACKYEVWTDGYKNRSIETGDLIKNILSFPMKEELLSGKTELEINNMHIKLITDFEVKKAPEPVEEVKKEVEEVKPAAKKPAAKKKTKKG